MNEQEPQVLTKEIVKNSWNEYLQNSELPQAVVFDVTNVCNSPGCAHCYVNAVMAGDAASINMDIATVKEWADVLISNPKGRPEQAWISGGEPTLFDKLPSALQLLRENGFYTVLVTNGEKLANAKYCESLISSGNLDEVAVTVRGDGPVHDLFMLPADDPIWASVPKSNLDKDQIDKIKGRVGSANRFERTMRGVLNLSKNPELKIGLNIDIQAAGDMEQVVRKIKEKGGRVDYIYLQVQQEAGRVKESPEVPSNLWRKPTVDMVREYLEQSERLLKEKVVSKVVMIDPLPQGIVDNLKLKENHIYQPSSTPAISPSGKLRSNVLHI